MTDLGPDVTIGQLQQMGVFGEKQSFAIQFSEEAAFFQGAKVSGAIVDRNIYTMPGPVTLKGAFTVQRIR